MVNHIILAISTLPPKIKENTFQYPENQSYRIENCKSQLEPIPRLMMQMHPGEEEQFIIYELCSTQTLVEVEIDKEKGSAKGFFEERIKGCPEMGNRKVEFREIAIEDLRNPYAAVKEVIHQVRENYLASGSGNRLWVDTHGGMRDVAQIFSAILSLLKVDGIIPEQILGVEHGDENIIVDQKGAFDIFEYVTGMNDFINFGSAQVLEKYYLSIYDEKTDPDQKKVHGILKAMTKISDGTQLCDPKSYKEGILALRKTIREISEDPLLGIFADYIRKDYGEALIPSDPSKLHGDVPPLAIVERCLNKGLYQQALTFLESMMPEEFVKSKCLYIDDQDKQAVTDQKKNDRKHYLTDEHYLFDEYLNAEIIYAGGTSIPRGKKPAIWAIGELYKIHENSQGQKIGLWPRSFKIYQTLPVMHIGGKKKRDRQDADLINVKTTLLAKDLVIFLRLLQIHKVLKQCRNLFNHCNGERPHIKEIDRVLRLYILYAKKVLK